MTETIELLRTCYAYPERYDAKLNGEMVGYLRLRHGGFTVECPDCGGDMVYQASPRGGGLFEDDERDYYLRFAVDAILKWIERGRTPPEAPGAPDVSYRIVGA